MTRRVPLFLVVLSLLFVAAGIVAAQRGERRRRRRRPVPTPAQTAEAAHPSITDDIPCSACHTPDGWSLSGGDSSAGGFDHGRLGFPLTGRHRTLGCTDCHAARREVRRDCGSCHQDTHQSRMGQDCSRCHTAVAWTDTRALEIHRLTRLPLAGAHLIAACTDCHQRTGDRQFTAVPAECFSCHEDDYRRAGVHPNHTGGATSPAFSRHCTQCHRTSSWSPAVVDPTTLGSTGMGLLERAPPQHEVRFPIRRGSHQGAECASCHEDRRVPSAIRCVGCHEHSQLRLRQQHRTARPGVDGRGCLGCHPGGIVR